MTIQTPITATGKCYEPYLIAAGQNLEALAKLAKELGDEAFTKAASSLLDAFHDYASDCQQIIDEANGDEGDDLTQRERAQLSIYRGLDQ